MKTKKYKIKIEYIEYYEFYFMKIDWIEMNFKFIFYN